MSADIVEKRLEDDGRTDCERWKAAAIQAKDDLRAIEEAFRVATPLDEDGPDPPIVPGSVFAQWTSPANTMRWIEEMEQKPNDGLAPERKALVLDMLYRSASSDVRELLDEITRLRTENERLENELIEWQEHADKKRARVEELEELRDWVLLYDDAIKEDNDADVVFHDMVKSARALTD